MCVCCGSSTLHEQTGETPLHAALAAGQVEAAALLLATAKTEAELEHALKDLRCRYAVHVRSAPPPAHSPMTSQRQLPPARDC